MGNFQIESFCLYLQKQKFAPSFGFRHYAVYSDVSLGPTRVSGVVHDGAYIANAVVPEEGIGPCRAIVANRDSKGAEEPVRAKDSSIQDAESIQE